MNIIGEQVQTAAGATAMEWDLAGAHGWDSIWERAVAFVAERWPEAKLEDVGYWRIPRVAHIYYNVGRVTYEPMSGKALPSAS